MILRYLRLCAISIDSPLYIKSGVLSWLYLASFWLFALIVSLMIDKIFLCQKVSYVAIIRKIVMCWPNIFLAFVTYCIYNQHMTSTSIGWAPNSNNTIDYNVEDLILIAMLQLLLIFSISSHALSEIMPPYTSIS